MILSCSSQKGILLTEVLITLLLMSMVLIALARFQVTALQNNRLANSRTIAVNLAQNKIETIRNITDHATFQAITDGTESAGPPGSNADLIIEGLNTIYTCLWSITGDIATGNIQLDVSVSWPDRNGNDNPASRITLSSNIGDMSAVSRGLLF
jgi:Tfp pilus assembly protein PilV